MGRGEFMVAVDALGGDFAPRVVVQGALQAACAGVPVVLFGPYEEIIALLDAEEVSWRVFPIMVEHAPEQIGMDEEPVMAVRKRQLSSMVTAVRSLKQGRCTAVVSAGNSGALMVASALLLGKQGCERPAIAGLLPSCKEPVVGLDLGANVSCRPHHLVEFAHLGIAYARHILKKNSPSFGLLANGSEDCKGSELGRETFPLLKELPYDFVGNIEPIDIVKHKVDVVVCDGFTGNILLKTMEAMIEFLHKGDFGEEFSWQPRKMSSESLVGAGALLLGVKGTVVVCHGAAHANDIKRAIMFAHNSYQEPIIAYHEKVKEGYI